MLALPFIVCGFLNLSPQETAAYHSGVTQAKLAVVLLADNDATDPDKPQPVKPQPDKPQPDGPRPGDVCSNCAGTGKVGDANSIQLECLVCDGDGRIDERDIAEEHPANNADITTELDALLRRIERLEAWQAKQIAWSKALVDWCNRNRCRCEPTGGYQQVKPLPQFDSIPLGDVQPRCVNGQCPPRSWRW